MICLPVYTEGCSDFACYSTRRTNIVSPRYMNTSGVFNASD